MSKSRKRSVNSTVGGPRSSRRDGERNRPSVTKLGSGLAVGFFVVFAAIVIVVSLFVSGVFSGDSSGSAASISSIMSLSVALTSV
ncbi:hypothetical protein [Bifidobacterium simiarum]|uniref:hypothetical protein n=1 Tax=Bifidobacterium simiarum TaxID=2045441 RepID=UPI0010549F50|nr:hypothetical protein [Bifidobacterium simiarum]